ncbi:MAG: spore protease YyaC [Actinomycetota bacterium]
MNTPTIISSTDPAALSRLSLVMEGALGSRGAADRAVVFACIGTDRSTGDALGPLVGQKLSRLGMEDRFIVGTLEDPLHALNIADRLGPVLAGDPPPLVVAVDAALGPLASVGSIAVRPGGLRPGQGVGKDLPVIGDLAVTATVNVAARGLDAQVLQSTRLFHVQQMADLIGVACWWALRTVRREVEPAGAREARAA